MSAAEAISAARAAGVRLGTDGDDLVLEASAPPPDTVLDLLSRHKPGIVALLRPGRDGWLAEDWQAFFDERAGIAGGELIAFSLRPHSGAYRLFLAPPSEGSSGSKLRLRNGRSLAAKLTPAMRSRTAELG